VTYKERGTPPSDSQWRELHAMIVETDRLLRLLGEDPDAPVDLTALIANGQSALDAVLDSPQHAGNLRWLLRLTNTQCDEG
jgi:hypothetical protein